MRGIPFTGLWRHGDFLRLWAAHTVSQLGTRVTFVAMPPVAVVTLGASPVQVGILGAVGSVPALGLGLFAGAWVDRLRRRPVLFLADLGRALVLGAIPLMALLGLLRIWCLYTAVLLVGAMTLFFDVAYRSYLPSLVRREQLVEGNGKLEVSRSAAEIGGPAVAGGLVQAFTAPLAILADALSFLVSAACLARIRASETAPGSAEAGEERRILREVGDGLKALLGNPTLRSLTSCTGAISFFNAAIEAVLVVYLVRRLGLSAATVGIVFSVGGFGFLLGAVLAGRIAGRASLGAVLICGPILIGAADLLIPLAGGPRILAVGLPCAAQFLFGVGLPIYRVNEVSLRQAITPERFLGRVNSGEYLVREGLLPFGALLGGLLGEAIGLRPTLAIGALGEMAASLWVFFSPVRALREHPGDAPE